MAYIYPWDKVIQLSRNRALVAFESDNKDLMHEDERDDEDKF